MLKKSLFPILYALIFCISTGFFWYTAAELYRTPFIWMDLGLELQKKLVPIGIAVIGTIFSASLLTIFKPHAFFSKITYFGGASLSFLFLPQTELTFLASAIFTAGFLLYESATTDTFHSYIKIRFWETYSRTIPGLLTAFAFCVAVGSFQASSLAVETFQITLPESVVEQTVQFLQPQPEPQLETIDPSAQALIDQIQEFVPGVQTQTQEFLIEQTKLQLENRINQSIDQYRTFIPIISAAAIFFFFSILNFPVMILSTVIVSATMKLLTLTKVISVVTVKMDVERFAW